MSWTTSPPPLDEPYFRSPLSRISNILAERLANSFTAGHRVSVVQLHTSLMQIRDLTNVVEAIPEIAFHYGQLTGHQMKVVAVVDPVVPHETPYRDGNLRIKKERWPVKSPPHIAFLNKYEAKRFGSFGHGTLVVIVKRGGALKGMEKLIESMATAIANRRVESLLIITDCVTSRADWAAANNHFFNHGVTIGYSQLRIDDVL